MRLRSLAWILACAVALAGPAAVAVELRMGSGWDDKRPWFCHGLDCPVFEVLDTTDAYEVREYKEGEVKGEIEVSHEQSHANLSIPCRRVGHYLRGVVQLCAGGAHRVQGEPALCVCCALVATLTLTRPPTAQRLFAYIDGGNEEGVKIPMTSPVLTSVTPSCGPFCKQNFNISFFVPFHLQVRCFH